MRFFDNAGVIRSNRLGMHQNYHVYYDHYLVSHTVPPKKKRKKNPPKVVLRGSNERSSFLIYDRSTLRCEREPQSLRAGESVDEA